MGGAESSSKYGGMWVQVDSPFYISGSQVTGKISVMISQPYPALRLKLRVEGREYCRWYESHQQNNHYGDNHYGNHYNHTTYEKHDHSETIFFYEVIIYEFYQQSINPGQYVFPFSFYLPKECPSSTYFTGDESALGVITYKVTGIFDSTYGGDLQPIQNEWVMTVRQTKMEVNANLQSYAEKDVDSCCCCCSGGITKVGALFEKNAYSTSETARALINVDNTSSKLAIDHISMKLIQHVKLNTNGHHYSRSYTVCKQQYPGLEAGKHWENMPLEINLANSKQTFHNQNQEETKNFTYEELKMWEFIQPTTNGKWVNIQYTKIQAKLDFKINYDLIIINFVSHFFSL